MTAAANLLPSTKGATAPIPSLATDPGHAEHHQSPWLAVMCLTGVDYFSTLGYQPYLAFEAAGLLAPLATGVLVLLTLFGALPVYSHVASKSPLGQGSIAMLEKLLHGWVGKTLVLVLLGFAATDFIITKTLSAADAAVHLVENHYWEEFRVNHAPPWLATMGIDRERMVFTLALLTMLGAMFLRGFQEVIGVAVAITVVFLALNAIIIGAGIGYLIFHPQYFFDWFNSVQSGHWEINPDHIPLSGTGWWTILGISLLIFPKLALGLSGFETGVAVMPLVQGDPGDDPHHPAGRIRNTRKLLLVAALIMSVMLIGSSIVTATLVNPIFLHRFSVEEVARMSPAELDHLPGDKDKIQSKGYRGLAVERTLAFLAHGEGKNLQRLHVPIFGEIFGTIYDISTIAILAFAGASAMAGLLNLMPKYLPRYGMAPEWARATRPLVILFTVINLFVTWVFNADVTAQGAAYATGVLVLMSSACLATLIDKWREHRHQGILAWPWAYALITGVFFYTTAANVYERPTGMIIASCFILSILVASFWSRLQRSTELRFQGFEFADDQSRFLWESLKFLEFPVLVPHRPGNRDLIQKDANIRQRHRLGPEVPVVFIEAELGDPSEFEMKPLMTIREEEGRFVIGVQRCVSIAHVIAIISLELSRNGTPPEIHFGWSNESPMAASFSFLLFGEGNIPWMVSELIRKAEPDPAKQPQVFIG
ncbi:MAG: hypothetical protein SFX18_19405 [Pirellulales bacterium]|nr:hypothetical protein [Pirellulales bacterium]